MEKNRNPNSHECLLRQEPSSSWSELPLDLLISVFERLGFADFTRGKSVCSSWRSALRQFVSKNHIPWLILFPRKRKTKKKLCTLINPNEKDKLYKTQDLGLEFAKSVCVATYGNWLLMQDSRFNLYILNLFTQERINLDCESRGVDDIPSPVFWIDEKTKDYVVILELKDLCVAYSKKGDNSWNQIPETSDCIDLVYKDHKLYFLSRFGNFKIFDFSGEIPQETFQSGVIVNEPSLGWNVHTTKLVVTVNGDILKVERMFSPSLAKLSFCIYKVCSSASGFLNKPEQVDSLGDEAMIFDLGVTFLANDVEGFHRNSIYFIGRRDIKAIYLFNLEAQQLKALENFYFPSPQFSRVRWFLPSFMQT